SELLAGNGTHLAVAFGQVLPPTGDLGRMDHAGLELVEVRQGDGHGDRGRRSMAGLPSRGHQEPGTSRGAAEEGEGEETAFGGRHRSSSFPGAWMPAESEIGPGPLPTPCATHDRGLCAKLAAFSGRFRLHSDENPFG